MEYLSRFAFLYSMRPCDVGAMQVWEFDRLAGDSEFYLKLSIKGGQ